MSTFNLIQGSCADQIADVVVNAANSGLWEGSGICGAIFNKCGSKELTQACSAIPTPVKDGDAVITPAFNMKMLDTLYMPLVQILEEHQKLFWNFLMLTTILLLY